MPKLAPLNIMVRNKKDTSISDGRSYDMFLNTDNRYEASIPTDLETQYEAACEPGPWHYPEEPRVGWKTHAIGAALGIGCIAAAIYSAGQF